MGIKKLSPTSPARRYQTYLTNDELTTSTPHRPLLESKKCTSGRNNLGKMTVRHRGGGHKRHYRIVDFKRDKFGVPGKVATIEYSASATSPADAGLSSGVLARRRTIRRDRASGTSGLRRRGGAG